MRTRAERAAKRSGTFLRFHGIRIKEDVCAKREKGADEKFRNVLREKRKNEAESNRVVLWISE